MENKKTVVIGASTNESRYSFKAVKLLLKYAHTVVPLGIKEGTIKGYKIIIGKPKIENVHTITMYVGSKRQNDYYDYIISLKPKRVIFNPGTENPEFYNLLKKENIEIVQNCTLIMLNSNNF